MQTHTDHGRKPLSHKVKNERMDGEEGSDAWSNEVGPPPPPTATTDRLTPLQATGAFDDPGITCTVDSWAGPVRAGLHPATGGDGGDACSGDMLLQAVLACAGVTMRSVATALGIDIRSATLHANGQFDARGTLGISRDTPVGVGASAHRRAGHRRMTASVSLPRLLRGRAPHRARADARLSAASSGRD